MITLSIREQAFRYFYKQDIVLFSHDGRQVCIVLSRIGGDVWFCYRRRTKKMNVILAMIIGSAMHDVIVDKHTGPFCWGTK